MNEELNQEVVADETQEQVETASEETSVEETEGTEAEATE